MKYGRLTFGCGNIGDQTQVIGLDALYASMNIPKEDIVDLSFGQLSMYRGEKVIFPIFGCMISKDEDLEYARYHSPSPDIIPVFLGFFAADYGAPDMFAKFLAKNGDLPILCRDELSASIFRKKGYKAEFWGCLSLLTQVATDISPKKNTVFYESTVLKNAKTLDINDLIPEPLRQYPKVELFSQDIMDDEQHMSLSCKDRNEREYALMLQREKLLAEQAVYVVASSIHLTLPCIAMGIPVLFAGPDNSDRNILPHSLYKYCNPKKYDDCRLPPTPSIDAIKAQLMETARDLLLCACRREEENEALVAKVINVKNMYMPQKKAHYKLPITNRGYIGIDCMRPSMGDDFFYKLTGKLPQDTDLVFYGTGELGRITLQNMYELVKKCRSFTFIDSDKAKHTQNFAGFFPVEGPDSIEKYNKENLTIFITMSGSTDGPAEEVARYLETRHNLVNGVHFYWYEYIVMSLFQVCFGYPAYVPSFYPPSKRMV